MPRQALSPYVSKEFVHIHAEEKVKDMYHCADRQRNRAVESIAYSMDVCLHFILTILLKKFYQLK